MLYLTLLPPSGQKMVTPNARPLPAPGAEPWDEARIEQALKTLQDLHIQLRELRSTIPRMQERFGGPVASGKFLTPPSDLVLMLSMTYSGRTRHSNQGCYSGCLQ